MMYFTLFVGLAYLYSKNLEPKLYITFVISLILKIAAGIAIGLLYSRYYDYSGDTFFYHAEGVRLSKIISRNFLEGLKIIFFEGSANSNPRAFFFIKIIGLLNFLTASNYWINGAFCSIFSFIGAWSLCVYLHRNNIVDIWWGAVSLMLLPSTLLWSSGLLKESLVFGSLCFLVKYTYKFTVEFKLSIARVFFIIFLIFLLINLRYFYAAIFIPVTFSFVVSKVLQKKYPKVKIRLLFLGLVLGSLSLATLAHPNLSLDYVSTVLLENYNKVKRISDAGDSFDLFIGKNLFSDLRVVPQAIFTGLFRPFPWDLALGIKTFAGIENLAVLLISLLALLTFIKKKRLDLEPLAILTYVFFLSFAIAVVCPNWGSLLRYRIGYQPFFVLLIVQVGSNSDLVKPKIKTNQRSST
ncbi:MAG TPA: hypothetical protein VF691_08805 [Cytophagaceae bacterium]